MSAPLPTWRALIILSRPRLLPYVLLLTAAGYGWAHWDRALTLRGGWAWVAVLVAWTLLNAGTLWLNAALDRDEGEVLLGTSVPCPPGIVGYAYVALVLAVGVAFFGTPLSGIACLGCAVLAVLYSHPKAAWKQHPFGGPFVNLVGYGLLTPLAGWASVGVRLDQRTAVAWVLGATGILGAYFAAQAFQGPEDGARGYRTLVVTHGSRFTIQAARVCMVGGFAGGGVLAAIGWIPRVCLVAFPLALWIDRFFAEWAEQPGGGDERWVRRLASRLLVAGFIAFALTVALYLHQSFNDEPVAGLGTAAGLPPDRPVLNPAAIAVWEREHPEGALR